ncbi:phytoene/squalene synthase family protein [Jatrophihabitans sp.]|uniref:phytoene/squalene synthase family protein n=1 Tax=Jatrophihabitans sp. TaxID=1932789 RepID=UPI002BDD3BCD|nr:phytoene/squalene synthase family protein [Jatrophihabitans sp.]
MTTDRAEEDRVPQSQTSVPFRIPAAGTGPARPMPSADAGRASRGARRELAAAGIVEPGLRAGYLRARQLNAQHGKTYFLATQLLPAAKRPYVHALYGFARYADDIVDDLDPRLDQAERARTFDAWARTFLADLQRGTAADPLCLAVLDTIDHWQIPAEHFADFLQSMRMDLEITEYAGFADLEKYMWGSAAVIGLQMLPILGRADPRVSWSRLRGPAADLGLAFQLTNFLRDVAEDLDRGRIYLPIESLDRFGVDRAMLLRARAGGSAGEPIRDLIAYEVARTRRLYASALPGIDLVHRTSRDCLRTAWTLYGGILDEIERAGYDVFSRRVSVGLRRRLSVAAGGLVRAAWARAVD